jgi:replication-associated recombination protein RarA
VTIIADETTPGVEEGRRSISSTALDYLSNIVDGDARSALNTMQILLDAGEGGEEEDGERLVTIGLEDVKEAARRSHVLYDRTGDQHYFMASALQKSIRGQGLLSIDEIYCTVRVPGPPLPLNPGLNF